MQTRDGVPSLSLSNTDLIPTQILNEQTKVGPLLNTHQEFGRKRIGLFRRNQIMSDQAKSLQAINTKSENFEPTELKDLYA